MRRGKICKYASHTTVKSVKKEGAKLRAFLWKNFPYFAALAALNASMSIGVTLNRSPQMP